MGYDLKIEGGKLLQQEELLSETCEWWSNRIQRSISEYVYLSEKLKEEWDEKILARCEELENEIKNLNLKKNWELKENEKFQQKKESFKKKQNKDFMLELSSKLSKKFKHPKT